MYVWNCLYLVHYTLTDDHIYRKINGLHPILITDFKGGKVKETKVFLFIILLTEHQNRQTEIAFEWNYH